MSGPRNLLVIADRLHTFGAAVPPRVPVGVVVRAGRIAAFGAPHEMRALAGDALELDLSGSTLTPGLTDSHIHLTEWALARRDVDLRDARAPEEVVPALANARPGPGGWIRGRGWNAAPWATPPHRNVLDAVAPDRPVVLQSHDMHALWVNGAALRAAGIDESSADPPGGRIVRDAHGAPTGLLLENAAALITRVLPAPAIDDVLAAVIDAQAELHGLGITGVHSLPGIHVPEPDPLPVLQQLHERDTLRLRVLHHLAVDHLADAIRIGLRSGFGGEWIRIGGVKLFLDGTLGSRTAWMRAPYEGEDQCGIRLLEPAAFIDTVRHAALAGIATTVHAIGDAAVALALRVLAAPDLPRAAIPHRIEHVQCCPPDLLAEAGRAGIVCSVQPAHLITDWQAADRNWGAARGAVTYAFASLRSHGAVLAFGSDAPVEPVDPRLALFAATERRDLKGQPAGGWHATERIGLADAFRAYTLGPAHAAGIASDGIVPGAPADLVAWQGDPLQAAGENLLRLRVAATIVGGHVVHS